LRIAADGPAVLQVSARLGANHEAALVEAALGIDLNRLAVASALGWPSSDADLQPRRRERVGAAIVAFLAAPEEATGAVDVPDGLAQVSRSWIYREPGHRYGPLLRPSDRAGAILLTGEDSEAAALAASVALERIRFTAADAGTLV
jgi:hypothetical protein